MKKRTGACCRIIAFSALLCLASLWQPALADTWLPNSATAVINIDEKLAKRLSLTQDFAEKISAKAAVHDLNILVVMTEEDNDLGTDRSRWAPELLHNTLWTKLQSSGFPEERALVLLYVRSKNSPQGSVAVRSGSYLHKLGVDRNLFASTTGPVIPTAKQLMQKDPQSCILNILANINNAISSKKAENPSGQISTAPAPVAENATPPQADSSAPNYGEILSLGAFFAMLAAAVYGLFKLFRMADPKPSNSRGARASALGGAAYSDSSSCGSNSSSCGGSSSSGSSCGSSDSGSSCGSSCGGGGSD